MECCWIDYGDMYDIEPWEVDLVGKEAYIWR